MNYSIPGMEKMILELFVMFDTAKVEIKKEHQVLMVSKTTSFKKGKGKKGNFENDKSVVGPKSLDVISQSPIRLLHTRLQLCQSCWSLACSFERPDKHSGEVFPRVNAAG